MLSFLCFREMPAKNKDSRRERVPLGRQKENQAKQRFVLSVPVFSEGSLKRAVPFL